MLLWVLLRLHFDDDFLEEDLHVVQKSVDHVFDVAGVEFLLFLCCGF
jgi:hypothetical protein